MGRAALARQHDAFARIVARDYARRADLPRLVQPLAVAGRGVARTHAPVYRGERRVGYVTSGTSVPYWVFAGRGLDSQPTGERAQRSIALAYLDCDVVEDDGESRSTCAARGCPAWSCPSACAATRRRWARPIVYDHKLPELRAAGRRAGGKGPPAAHGRPWPTPLGASASA